MLDLDLSLESRAVFGGAPAFAPLSTSPTAWYDPSDLSTLFQDIAGTTPVTAHGDPVGTMRDKSGNGYHLTAITDAQRPLYQVSGAERFLLFDGADDVLRNGAIASHTTLPFDRMSAIRQATWTSGDRIFTTTDANGNGQLIQRPSSPNISVNDGIGDVVNNAGLAIGSNGVVTERHIANASRLAVNNGNYVTGDAGAASPGGRLFVGARHDSGANAANIRLYGLVLKVGGFTDAQIASWRAWLGGKCGLSL